MTDPAFASPRHAAIASARSLLFMPGGRAERFPKGLASGADAVVVDLEDSVPAADKDAARQAVADAWELLTAASVPVIVRINAPFTAVGADDLAWLAHRAAPAGVMVPKCESAPALDAVRHAAPGAALLPLVETAAGWHGLPQIAAASGVLRLVVGHIDFMADTGIRCSPDERELDPLRFAVAMHSRLQGLQPAIDGVTVSIDDVPRLQADTRRAMAFGFGGKLCIHPRQVAVVHDAMRPSVSEADWARRVVAADAASGGAAVQLDGRMVDLPVVLQARRTLARLARG